ncbi:MAG: ABC transporter ATP-binding protein [Candidatus Promineifilaceae bacterium]
MSDQYFDEEEFNQSMSGSTLKRITKVGLRHWPLMLLFVTCILSVSIIESYMTVLTQRIIDEGVVPGDMEALNRISLQYGLLWFIFAVFVVGMILGAAYLGQRVQRDLRTELFAHLQKLHLGYYDRTPTGWLQSRVISDVMRVGDLVSWGYLDMTWAVGAIGSSLAFMFWMNWQLALIVMLIVPIIIIIAIQFQQRILHEFRASRKANSRITAAFSQMITGVRVVKALRREKPNLGVFEERTSEMFAASYRANWLSALFLPLVQLVTAFGIVATIWAGGWQLQAGNLQIGMIQAFISYITFMLWPIQQLAMVYASMQKAIASAERIFSLLDTDPDIVNSQHAIHIDSLEGDIVFNNVSFAYEADKPVLRDFSLTVKQGETIAIVGPTGAGKSTIINLVARFYEPTNGIIELAGYDYRDLTLNSIQSHIGMVLQTPYLFSGTILDNIRYGRLDANDVEVHAAAEMAGADSFVKALEKGYETQVGEDGVLLSVGQKQLLSLARAILAQPDIFIMDEATSSVDTLTEALIQRGMDQLMTGRTSFVIAHRLSTIKNADRILVMKDGQIDEIGSHAELIRQRGHYYDLYTKQFRRERHAVLDWSSAEIKPAFG